MYSFYGGKQGRTYKLVQHYDSIYQMVQAFQQGGSYNAVNYGEYVIIDTIVNDNHYGSPENGIIYRRGLNFNQNFNPNNTQDNEILVNENNTISKEDTYPLDYRFPEKAGKKIYYIYGQDLQGNQTLTFDEEKFRSTFSAFAQNPGGGAQYVGQIVGPQGEAPQLSLISWTQFLQRYEDPAAADLNKNTFTINPPPGVQFDPDTGEIVEDSFKDTIDYGYLDIKDAYGNITGAYISLNIPKAIFKYHAESIEPYPDYIDENTREGRYFSHEGIAVYTGGDQETGVGGLWEYTNLITEDEISLNHNYFWQYDMKVPKGIKGQDLYKFDIDIDDTLISPDGNDILHDQDDNNYRYYRIYKNYDKSPEGVQIKQYLDSWQRTIHKITDDGNIPNYDLIQRETDYDAGDRVSANGLANNLFLMALTDGVTDSAPLPPLQTFERGKTFVDGTVTWQVFEDTVASPGLLTVHYTHGNDDTIAIRLLDDIYINQNNGRIYAKYSDLASSVYLGENQSIIAVDYIDTPWIDQNNVRHTIDRLRIKFNTFNYDENGQVVVNADYSLDQQGNIVFPTTDGVGRRVQFIDEQFKFLDRIDINEYTKEVTAYYNDGTASDLGVLKAIKDVYVENEGDLNEPKYWAVQYNNLSNGDYQTDRINQHPLNEIASIQQYGDNIIVLYSDQSVRRDLFTNGVDYALPNDLYRIPNYDNLTGDDDNNGNLYWINLGSIYHSNHIIGNFSSQADLKATYPFGLERDSNGQLVPQHKDHAGWIATVTDSQTGTVTLYAYDYFGTISDDPDVSKENWYQISDMSAATVKPDWSLMMSKPTANNPAVPLDTAKSNLLQQNGYWFVISERAD